MADDQSTTDEIWKAIPGYEGLYQVSNTGLVRSASRPGNPYAGRILKPAFKKGGRAMYGLCKHGKQTSFNRANLIALAFIGPPPTPKHETNHIDGDPSNDGIENLEWVTSSENKLHAYKTGLRPTGERNWHAKLTDSEVREIRHLLKTQTQTQKSIAKQFSVSRRAIGLIKSGINWKHLKP